MFQHIAKAEAKEWQAGPYAGVELKPLHKDEQNRGGVVLRKFHAGVTVPVTFIRRPTSGPTSCRANGKSPSLLRKRHVVSRTERRSSRTAHRQNGSHQSYGIRWTIDRGGLLIRTDPRRETGRICGRFRIRFRKTGNGCDPFPAFHRLPAPCGCPHRHKVGVRKRRRLTRLPFLRGDTRP